MRKHYLVDLDGVIADYHKTFLEFGNNWLRKKWNLFGFRDFYSFMYYMKDRPGMLEELKWIYRKSGIKSYMASFPESKQFIRQLNRRGEMSFMTSRPLTHRKVHSDTLQWLTRFPSKTLLDKYDVRCLYGYDYIAIEDDVEWAQDFSELTNISRVYLLDRSSNLITLREREETEGKIIIVKNEEEIINYEQAKTSNI